MKLRLTEEEHGLISKAAEAEGQALAAWAAEAALTELMHASGQLHRVGTNLNQAVRHLNATGQAPEFFGPYRRVLRAGGRPLPTPPRKSYGTAYRDREGHPRDQGGGPDSLLVRAGRAQPPIATTGPVMLLDVAEDNLIYVEGWRLNGMLNGMATVREAWQAWDAVLGVSLSPDETRKMIRSLIGDLND